MAFPYSSIGAVLPSPRTAPEKTDFDQMVERHGVNGTELTTKVERKTRFNFDYGSRSFFFDTRQPPVLLNPPKSVAKVIGGAPVPAPAIPGNAAEPGRYRVGVWNKDYHVARGAGRDITAEPNAETDGDKGNDLIYVDAQLSENGNYYDIDGGAGYDAARFTGSMNDYSVKKLGDGTVSVFSSKFKQVAILRNIEEVSFSDGNLSLAGPNKLDGMDGVHDNGSVTPDAAMMMHKNSGTVVPVSGMGLLFSRNNDYSGADKFHETRGKGYNFYSGVNNEKIIGSSGSDYITVNGGKDMIDGGAGYDAVKLQGAPKDYSIKRHADGAITVQHKTRGDFAVMHNVEELAFDSVNMRL